MATLYESTRDKELKELKKNEEFSNVNEFLKKLENSDKDERQSENSYNSSGDCNS